MLWVGSLEAQDPALSGLLRGWRSFWKTKPLLLDTQHPSFSGAHSSLLRGVSRWAQWKAAGRALAPCLGGRALPAGWACVSSSGMSIRLPLTAQGDENTLKGHGQPAATDPAPGFPAGGEGGGVPLVNRPCAQCAPRGRQCRALGHQLVDGTCPSGGGEMTGNVCLPPTPLLAFPPLHVPWTLHTAPP